jgi:predicted unusual protein kinase regulating ubiquinone biosynthesis (AarF/ABC1/UbiB family)
MIDRITQSLRRLDSVRNRNHIASTTQQTADTDPVEASASQVHTFLLNNGPLLTSLGLYLSSRLDALPAAYCRQFARTPDTAPAIPAQHVERIMTAQLGMNFRDRFLEFDFAPVRSELFVQAHRAVLRHSEDVTVLLARPEFAAPAVADQVANELRHPAVREFASRFITNDLMLDFQAALRRSANLSRRSQAMERSRAEASAAGQETARKIYHELSGRNVLTTTNWETNFVDGMMDTLVRDGQRWARLLCQQWLRQSLCTRFCPVDPRPGNINLFGYRFSFDCNDFMELPKSTRQVLRDYLLATLIDDPDQAARALLQEMIAPKRVLDPGGFRSKFRQAAYFGALEPVLGTDTNTLAQLIFQHWKTAIEYGYTPTHRLLCFYRGLFSIARLARELAPESDSLREGMEELHAAMVIDEFGEMANANYWFQNVDKYAMTLINLPRDVDEALTRAAGASANESSGSMMDDGSHDAKTAWAGVLLLIAAIVFIMQSEASRWIEQSAALALMIAGLVGLRTWDH